jgi:site-specific DNA-methyltransferase (adenine-specific)
MSKAYMPQAKTVEWETPQEFFDRLDAEFDFRFDVAATETNHKCSEYSSNSLGLPWHTISSGAIWCNPPYGRVLADWVRKGYLESQGGCTVVMLLPARTDTKWWHDYVMTASEIRFVRGRLKFGGAANSATFPSVVVVFRGDTNVLKVSSIAASNRPHAGRK